MLLLGRRAAAASAVTRRLALRRLSNSSGSSGQSVAAARLRSPVTWISATATLGVLAGCYELQKTRQVRDRRATRVGWHDTIAL